MQVRQYPFHVDPPMSRGLRDTLMVADILSRACLSVTRARDQRVRILRAEARATAPAETTEFGDILGECGIGVGDFHQAVSRLMDDPASAPTVKDLFGALAGKETAAADLGARVQDLVTSRSAAPRPSGPASPPSGPAAGAAAAPPRPAPTGGARSSGFCWEFTSAALRGQARPSSDMTTESSPDEPKNDIKRAATSDPPPTHDAKADVADKAATMDSRPSSDPMTPKDGPAPSTAACGVKTEPVAETPPPTEGTSPPIDGEAVPTQVGIVLALETLSKQSEQLMKRLEALEALVESQATRLAEAERKLEAALRRLEAREEAARRQAQIQARTEQEVTELRERIARLEQQQAAPIGMPTVDPRRPEPANDVPQAAEAPAVRVEDVSSVPAEIQPPADDAIGSPSPAIEVPRAVADAESDVVAPTVDVKGEVLKDTEAADESRNPAALTTNREIEANAESDMAKQRMAEHVEHLTKSIRVAEGRVAKAEVQANCNEARFEKTSQLADLIDQLSGEPGKDH